MILKFLFKRKYLSYLRGFFFLCALFSFFSSVISAQDISGSLSVMHKQPVKLEGFNGFKSYEISESITDEKGNFKLNFDKSDHGVGYLISEDNKPFFVILTDENVVIQGEVLGNYESINTLQGRQNILFEEYAVEQPKREQALSAWIYLKKMYENDPIFAVQKSPYKAIEKEIERIKQEDMKFLNDLPEKSYLSWFLPTRRLVSSVSLIAQYRTYEIPATIAEFRQLDYSDLRLYKSGLLKDAIESHFWLLENSGEPLDSVFSEMRLSIDAMLKFLIQDEKIFNEVTLYLFDLLEKRSLSKASEYLALKVLNENSCSINSDLVNQLETYRIMRKGNIAPDIDFTGFNNSTSHGFESMPSKLSELKSKYTVVVFGASWCPQCNSELPELSKLYGKWKENGVEVVLVSLDEDSSSFYKLVKDFPFVTLCDFRKWTGKTVKDYFVFGTPTIFLLSQNLEILLRPNSVKQMDAWVDWYLVQGNK